MKLTKDVNRIQILTGGCNLPVWIAPGVDGMLIQSSNSADNFHFAYTIIIFNS